MYHLQSPFSSHWNYCLLYRKKSESISSDPTTTLRRDFWHRRGTDILWQKTGGWARFRFRSPLWPLLQQWRHLAFSNGALKRLGVMRAATLWDGSGGAEDGEANLLSSNCPFATPMCLAQSSKDVITPDRGPSLMFTVVWRRSLRCAVDMPWPVGGFFFCHSVSYPSSSNTTPQLHIIKLYMFVFIWRAEKKQRFFCRVCSICNNYDLQTFSTATNTPSYRNNVVDVVLFIFFATLFHDTRCKTSLMLCTRILLEPVFICYMRWIFASVLLRMQCIMYRSTSYIYPGWYFLANISR